MSATTKDRLSRLTSLSLDEREALANDLTAEFDAAEKDEDTAAMEAAVTGLERLDMYEQLLEEMDDFDESDDDADEGSEDLDEDDEDESDTDEVNSDEDDTLTLTDDEDEVVDTDSSTQTEGVAMAASAVKPEDLDNKETALTASVSVTAISGTDANGYNAGQAFRSREDIAEAMTDRINSTAGMPGARAVVASLRADMPAERSLSNQDAILNQSKIDAVMSEKAIVASGGFCAPLPVNYDVFGVGSTARPVRDSLPTFGATRGGIRYIAPPVLGSYTQALSLWTAANDANPTDPATKPTLKVNCAQEREATTDAVTLSLEFGNLMTRAFPELVQRHNQLALIEHARFAEKTLLSKISGLSSKVTTSHQRGMSRDLLGAVSRASAAYRNRHRIPRGIRLRAIMPDWTLDAIREDIASNMNVENLSVTDAVVTKWFADRGISITFHMDDTFAAQTPGAELNDWGGEIKFWLFAEGALLFLDGGTLDLGIIRDADLVSTNDYMTFVETFEGVAKVGLEVLEVTSTTGVGLPAAVTP